ncbi:type II toxin-antitoxin system PemK/MazF family toxin [Streptomyces sp. P9(2023)]|uniref:type II toxin-antitoxin system PemK/MazF family toxin n=1 Tax=Streptomyces sp. P9(2023) TaxID=3064394 RepID=UPI0028F417D7|nr:type II toxin-antitoxin system PemK/MazF family toxin [Streptomyces sp. P9(2023)]MDT9689276.1 type II toxin-antitoxin system PemK/MazF family toxin [Streptomyces sp. P9(2023)]
MDTSWWPALVAVVVIALVVALADGLKRSGRRPGGRPGQRPGGRTRPPARPPVRTRPPGKAPARLPLAGEIWWADVPYEDGPGSKDRPCLVLALRGDSALVAKITSKYHDERPGVIALPPGSVGDAHGRPSFLETDELREVPVWEFRRRVGTADPVVWDQVRHLA